MCWSPLSPPCWASLPHVLESSLYPPVPNPILESQELQTLWLLARIPILALEPLPSVHSTLNPSLLQSGCNKARDWYSAQLVKPFVLMPVVPFLFPGVPHQGWSWRGGEGGAVKNAKGKKENCFYLSCPLSLSPFSRYPHPILEARSIRSYQHCLNCFYFCFSMNSTSVTRNCIVIKDVDIHSWEQI